MRPGVKTSRKAVDIFSQRLPHVYFQLPPPLSFVTDKKAEWVLEDVVNAIVDKMKGTIIKQDKEKYKLSFYVNKLVDSGRYKKDTKEKEYEKVKVQASVQMWTHPGQKEALLDREKVLAAVADDKETLTDEEKAIISKKIPAIKSIAIFRAEGGGETRFLFPKIYTDILKELPA